MIRMLVPLEDSSPLSISSLPAGIMVSLGVTSTPGLLLWENYSKGGHISKGLCSPYSWVDWDPSDPQRKKEGKGSSSREEAESGKHNGKRERGGGGDSLGGMGKRQRKAGAQEMSGSLEGRKWRVMRQDGAGREETERGEIERQREGRDGENTAPW